MEKIFVGKIEEKKQAELLTFQEKLKRVNGFLAACVFVGYEQNKD